jgi:hypothetical protein
VATGSKYDRTIEAKYKNGNIVTDVYRVLDAFDVKSQRGATQPRRCCAPDYAGRATSSATS